MQYTDKYRSPLGEITLASDGDHLTGLWFDGQKYFAATLSAEHQERELPIFEQAKEWLDSYFMGKIPSFTPPIHLEDTPFRLAGQFRFQAGASRFAWVYYFPGFPVGRRAVSSAGNGAFEQCFLEFRSVFRR